EAEEERPFRRPALEEAADAGDEGTAGGAEELAEWFEDLGERQELAGLDGEGVEDGDGEDESTVEGPKENTIPPILPVELPEELRELPPILEAPEGGQLAGPTLPEIQERIDDFLALRDPSTWAMFAEN